jgi:NAD(P)-dependent dehydrogenase (short-subunit alcohol dehydrogenase family)
MTGKTLLIGSDTKDVRDFAATLDAELLALPAASEAGDWAFAGELEIWRDRENSGARYGRIVVAVWAEHLAEGAAIGLDPHGWESRAEQPLARWAVALGCAVSRCADDGAIVAVVDGPTTLECAGWAPETAVAEGVRAFARSLALSEGARGIRVNTVSTPARLPLGPLVHPAPPLASFPGRLDHEVAGAVRMLLSPDAVGVTGGIVHADAGRSWR